MEIKHSTLNTQYSTTKGSPYEAKQIRMDGFSIFQLFYLFIDYCVLLIECLNKIILLE